MAVRQPEWGMFRCLEVAKEGRKGVWVEPGWWHVLALLENEGPFDDLAVPRGVSFL